MFINFSFHMIFKFQFYSGYQLHFNWFILISIASIYAVFAFCFGWKVYGAGDALSAIRNKRGISRNLNVSVWAILIKYWIVAAFFVDFHPSVYNVSVMSVLCSRFYICARFWKHQQNPLCIGSHISRFVSGGKITNSQFTFFLLILGSPAIIYLCLNSGIRHTILEGFALLDIPFGKRLFAQSKRDSTTFVLPAVSNR